MSPCICAASTCGSSQSIRHSQTTWASQTCSLLPSWLSSCVDQPVQCLGQHPVCSSHFPHLSHHRHLPCGWDAHFEGHMTHGLWTPREMWKHVKILEFQPPCLLSSPAPCSQHIQLLSDNMTAIVYINRQNGAQSSSLCTGAIHLWNWCLGVTFHAIHPWLQQLHGGHT